MSCTHRIVAYIEENPFRQGWRAMVKRHIGKLKHAPPERQTLGNRVLLDFFDLSGVARVM